MLQKFRAFSEGKIAKLFLAMILLSFVLWGMGDMFRHATAKYVAKIGNQEISAAEFDYTLRDEMSRARAQFGPDLANLMMPNIKSNLVERMTNRVLLAREIHDLGFAVSDSVVADHIKSTPIFAGTDGKFSREKFEELVRRSGKNEKQLAEELRQDIAIGELSSLYAKPAIVPEPLLEAHYLFQNEKRKIELYTIKADSTMNIPAPKAEELQEYYKAHDAEFKQPEARAAEYILISANTLKVDLKVTDEEVRQEFDENRDVYATPEKRDVLQIITEKQEDAEQALKEIQDGAKFETVQGKYGAKQDKNSLKLSGLANTDLPEGVAEPVFKLAKGEVSGVLKSALGFHVFKVSEIHASSEAKFEDVKNKVASDLKIRKQEEKLYDIIGKIDDMAASSAPLSEIASKYGMEVKKTPLLEMSGKTKDGKAPEEIAKLTDFVKVLFSTEAKSNSSVKEIGKGEYYVLSASDVVAESTKPYDKVKPEVEAALKKSKHQAALKEVAEKLAKAENPTKDGQNLKVLSEKSTLAIGRKAEGASEKLPPLLISEIFKLKVGESSQAVAVGDGSYAFAKLTEVVPATFDKNSDAAKALKANLQKQIEDDLFSLYINSLHSKYNVKFNYEVMDSVGSSDTK